jgi:hypothetical protein
MRKVCKKHGVNVRMDDPFVKEDFDYIPANEYDAVIVMTPHTGTQSEWPLDWFRKDCIIADIWKLYPESGMSNSGIYRVGDFK